MIRTTTVALVATISLATVARAGPVADALDAALTVQDQQSMAANVRSLVEAKIAGWMIAGMCADGSLEKIEAIDAGRVPGHTCCTAAYRNGSEYVDVVDGVALMPWTPSLPATERNSVIRIIAGEVMAMPEAGLKGKLAENSKAVRAEGRPICEAAIEDEARRATSGQ